MSVVTRGNISFVPSPTGKGLKLDELSQAYVVLGHVSRSCLVNPSTCRNGFTISMFVRMEGLNNFKRFFGNSLQGQSGVEISARNYELNIYVLTNTIRCQYRNMQCLGTGWHYITFGWRGTGLFNETSQILVVNGINHPISIKSKPSCSNVKEDEVYVPGTDFTLAQQSPQNTEYDNIAIWYEVLKDKQIKNIFKYARGKSTYYWR